VRRRTDHQEVDVVIHHRRGVTHFDDAAGRRPPEAVRDSISDQAGVAEHRLIHDEGVLHGLSYTDIIDASVL
jgi:hypothetical protein